MAEVLRMRVRISGRVQGVGFRYSAYHEGHRLGLRGWVRNTHDGAVDCEVEGPVAAVEQYVAWCRRGPRTGLVTGVETLPPSDKALPDDFQVRY